VIEWTKRGTLYTYTSRGNVYWGFDQSIPAVAVKSEPSVSDTVFHCRSSFLFEVNTSFWTVCLYTTTRAAT